MPLPRILCAALLSGLAYVLVLPALAQTTPKAFIREDIASTATQLEERLKREISVAPNSDAARLVREGNAALGRDNARGALPLASQAVVAAPRDPLAWRLMARAAKALAPRDWRERYEMQERATAAAYLSYHRSRTKAEEAAALALLGEVFEWREMWRPALTAYRLSLDLEGAATVRDAYETLRESRGFRLTGNEVDADSATPRACFMFSEPLARGRVDFAPFVAITGRGDFAVIAEDSQICVEGLRHGERYAVVLRQGIPSTVQGETLLKNADYEIYVRDRKPSARGSGKAYVLPKAGQQGIPLVSVNTEKLGVKIMRIGDRNLINTVRDGGFLEPVEPYRLRQIVDNAGQQVWSGSMDVKSELNRDVVTAFPVSEAVGELKPGVYLLAAKPGEFTEKPTDSDGDDGGSEQLATQWFVVSDLGLTTFSGADGLHVLTRSLGDALPMRDVEVRLIAKNNEVLGSARTDAQGRARFEAGLSRGTGGLQPGLITAEKSGDYGFLDLTQSAFDLSDRGVKGRIAPSGLDAYVYTERGVYRSGETVHVTALLRDSVGNAVTGMPLTLVVRRPDGMEYRRTTVADQGAGGRSLAVPLLSSVAPGTWRVLTYADVKRAPIGEATFLVEDYVPERLEIALSSPSNVIRSGQNAEIEASIRYLYGAPGADLAISGETIVRLAKQSAVPGLAGFRVGVQSEPVEPNRSPIEEAGRSDARGIVKLAVSITEPETNLPLEAEFVITANENGGRGVTRSLTLPILPQGAVLGVKPLFAEGDLQAGQQAKFAVLLATGDGKRLARKGLKWQLSRVTKTYQWFYKDGRWAYESITNTRRISDGEIDTIETALTEIAAQVGWGTHRIEVRSGGNETAETGFDFTVGYLAEARADTPDVLDVVLDKASYGDGETMQVRITPRSAGQATLAIMSDRLAHLETIDLPAEGKTLSLKASAAWGPGAYLAVLAHRPLDAAQKRMPGRAIGLTWFAIGKETRNLSVELGAPALVRPRGTLTLPVKITNLRPGEESYVTVSAVDQGILALTRYTPPDASTFFFGQRQLSHELRDLYGALIDGMQGTRGAIRSGGDAPPPTTAEKPVQEPLARFSGVVRAGPDGSAPIAFDLPAFNGQVKVMAVAWSKDRTGEANADVAVRDPVVVQATAPRFLALGDRSRLHIEINPVEIEAGTFALNVNLKGPVTAALDPAWQSLRLEKGKKLDLVLPLTGAGLGVAELELTLVGQGLNLPQTLRLPLKSSAPSVVNRIARPIPNGQRLEVSHELLSELVPGSGSVSVSASPYAALDAAGLVASLDRYAYGCTEQVTSRALPLLYASRLASAENLAIDGTLDDKITDAIERVLSRQSGAGSFGLWTIGGNDLWLDAYVTDFLTRARERNFPVPAVAFVLALDRLRNQVTNVGEVRADEASGLAYALYVLARNGRPVMGDLRYLADNRLDAFPTPLARAQIGAALAALGDRTRSRAAFAAAEARFNAISAEDNAFRDDYGSKLRDGAGLLALLGESDGDKTMAGRLSSQIEDLRSKRRYLSTQEQSFLVLAAQALQKEMEAFTMSVDGSPHRGPFHRTLTAARLDERALVLANQSGADMRVILNVAGIPLKPEPALAQGYGIERQYFTLKGQEVKADQLRQNERYAVKLTIQDPSKRQGRLLIVDPLPAGLEIENAALGGSVSTEGLAFLGELTVAEHTEARDDRFVAALDHRPNDKSGTSFALAYVVRAVTPGQYTHPAALVEDMYNPERFGRSAFGEADVVAFTAGARP
ncbi:COG2373 Large extracellular alpha-helical protein [Rhabdaerophilaceae bacterium]